MKRFTESQEWGFIFIDAVINVQHATEIGYKLVQARHLVEPSTVCVREPLQQTH